MESKNKWMVENLDRNTTRRPGISRRNLLILAGAQLLIGPAFAKPDSGKVIRLMVSAPPGGSLDFGARIVSKALAEELGTTVIVMNKGGAAGTINAADVAKATADGTTLLYATATAAVVAPQTMSPPPFDPLHDLIAINTVGSSAVALALNPKLGVNNLKALIELSRSRQITLGSSGNGSLMHLIIESVIKATGANFLHVPYRGAGPSIIDAVAGQIDGCFADLAPVSPFLQDKKLILAAVTTDQRLTGYPDVPTLGEDIPGFDVANWQGIFAPGKTPEPIIERLNAALLRVAARDEVRAQFRQGQMDVAPVKKPDTFETIVSKDYQRWGKLLEEMGMRKA
ncbi:Bug family tripartite tricarboxylate transporter substrate binding protein [Advenella mimigardefordensis]|uniref:Putative Bug-like extracytoplasmic solute binding receptor, TTT family n=1 Tax=Advenella mimigardefordensis (strain DSM 17166 / LMG 22922 / DPN7) TaxID=1247726 RepID=W0PB87_ADVMD|nr:tripartite tricarboxylate transporter substrate binding protein [Advenella mimigardefordensis]AHG64134.1 putative Bug-like extracytoplasmic solute binding receptor, TTT family [Advenella mimigardefordensis DPN7]